MYKDLYVPKTPLTSLVNTNSLDSYSGLISEEAGGIEIYLHNAVLHHVTCFLVWERPTMGFEINSVDHADYDGWASRGWDCDINSMSENYAINDVDGSQVFDIVIDGKVLAKTHAKEFIAKYKPLLEEWCRDYGNKTAKIPNLPPLD